MKVLVCASGNRDTLSPFVKEQAESLKKLDIEIDYFLIEGKGVCGYLKNIPAFRNMVDKGKYSLVHAHYGLSGLFATFQRKIPVIITFHGSDIHKKTNRPFSLLASRFSHKNIFVHPMQAHKLHLKQKDTTVIPCGVDLKTFTPSDKKNAREKMGWDLNKKYILFSSHFNNPIKNVSLALNAIDKIDQDIELIELKGFTKKEVALRMNAADLLLITSFSETGPLVAKEAMACNCPIVSTNVGDVKTLIHNTNLCFIVSNDPLNIQKKIELILKNNDRTNGQKKMPNYDLPHIAKRLKVIYKQCKIT